MEEKKIWHNSESLVEFMLVKTIPFLTEISKEYPWPCSYDVIASICFVVGPQGRTKGTNISINGHGAIHVRC